MKPRISIAACAALVLCFTAVPALAGPALTAKPGVYVPTPRQWARLGPFLGAAAPRHAGAGPLSHAAARNIGPLGIASLPWTEQMITADDWAAGDLYGYSTAVAGNTVFVGAPGATIGGNPDQGAVYVYQWSGGAWTQMQKLTASDGAAGDEFGINEAPSLSGTTLLVGAANSGGTGAVYVFADSGGTWTQTQRLTPADGSIGGFGYYVALQGDTAVVAAPGVATFTGAAYVFNDSGGTWTQTQKLTASDGAPNDWFGQSAGVSGSTIMVGQYPPPSQTAPAGAAYVFTNSGGTWTQTQKLQAGDGGTGDGFGWDLALSGSAALIAAAYVPDGGGNFGAAYVFHGSDGSWSQTQKLVGPADAEAYQMGNSVALVGHAAVVGSPVAASAIAGAAFVYARSGGGWNYTATLTATNPGPGELFGFAVALSGNRAVATSIPDFGGGVGPDAAYVFSPGCPQGYQMQSGTLDADGIEGLGSYSAPAGEEHAILGTFADLDLYLLYSNGGYPHLVNIPGNEVDRQAPGGVYEWGAKDAGGQGGAYTFCSEHP